MKKNILIYLIFIFINIVLINNVFSNSWNLNNYSEDNNKSIKELNEGISDLNKTNKELNKDFVILNKDYKLKNFFREYLANSEIKDIEYIITKYLSSKNKLEKILNEKAYKIEDSTEEKKLLLNEKKDFYKALLPFIKNDKIKEYLQYIALDVKILKEQKDVSEKIIINNEIISTKIEKIEWIIKEHREFLNEKFNSLVENKINIKIEKLKSNEKFNNLTNDLKKVVLNKILLKIQIIITNSENVIDKTDALVKKIEIYKIILNKLEELSDSLL